VYMVMIRLMANGCQSAGGNSKG